MDLTQQNCVSYEEGGTPMSEEEAKKLAKEIPGWTLKEKEIERQFRFKDFRQAINFLSQVANVAEEQNHHPDIFISYNKVSLTLTTHKVGGLSSNDFIMAAKINQLLERLNAAGVA